MRWHLSHAADPQVSRIADRHYNRQTLGALQFSPPGRKLVLKTPEAKAYWVTSWPFAEYVKHRWPGAWVCSAFRNEAPALYLSSELVLEAVAATRAHYGHPPPLGMVTFIDEDKVRRKRDPGRCFRRAGFEEDGRTEGGLVALRLRPERCPPPSVGDRNAVRAGALIKRDLVFMKGGTMGYKILFPDDLVVECDTVDEALEFVRRWMSSEASGAAKSLSNEAKRLGRIGGRAGGKARAAALTPERRSEISRVAANTRWGNVPAPPTTEAVTSSSETPDAHR